MSESSIVNINQYLKRAGDRVIHYYKDDLPQDLENMKKRFSVDNSDRYFYVMLRDCGSYAFRMRDVFLKETVPNIIWTTYNDPAYKSEAPIEAYAVKVEKIGSDGNLYGLVKKIPYEKSAEDVRKNAVPTGKLLVRFSDGTERSCSYKCPCLAHPDCPVVAKRTDDLKAVRFITLPDEAYADRYKETVSAREGV